MGISDQTGPPTQGRLQPQERQPGQSQQEEDRPLPRLRARRSDRSTAKQVGSTSSFADLKRAHPSLRMPSMGPPLCGFRFDSKRLGRGLCRFIHFLHDVLIHTLHDVLRHLFGLISDKLGLPADEISLNLG